MKSIWMKTAIYALVAIIGTFMITPIIVVIISSFSGTEFLTFPPTAYSLQWYAKFLGDDRWRAALYKSTIIGLMSCIMATAIGFMAAYGLVRGRFRGKKLVLSVMIMPLVVPGVITAISLYFVSSPLGLTGNVVWISLCHAVISIPIVLLILLSSLQGVDENLERAAFGMGASRFMTIRTVVLPLMMPGIVSAALFSFLGSFDELIVSLFLAGVSAETLPVRVWNSLLLQIEPTIAAVSAFLILITLAILLLDWAVKRSRSIA